MPALICGSLAFDTITTFPGRFAEQIMPDQVHILNVSFQHALSKSTSIYAYAASTDNAALSTYVTTGKNAFGVGINTNF